MRRFASYACHLALSLALAAGSAHAQTATESDPKDDILVRGKVEAPPEAVKRQARDISRMDDLIHEPLAQFQDPVCPGIAGMKTEWAQMMANRMLEVAERAGIAIARQEPCKPNILVLFVRDGKKGLKQLVKKSSYLFEGVPMSELKELLRDSGPVHAWSNTERRGRHGEYLQGGDSDLDPPVLRIPMSDSHVFLAIRRDIVTSVVLIDLAAVDGLSVVQIADYAAMRSFARTRPASADAAAGTILSLFDEGGARAQEITPFDIAYLRSLYGSMPNLPASAAIGGVPREIGKERAAGAAEKRTP